MTPMTCASDAGRRGGVGERFPNDGRGGGSEEPFRRWNGGRITFAAPPKPALIITAFACVLFSSTVRADAPIGIEVYPPQIRLDSARDRQRVLVQAVFADGRTEHVAAAALKPSDPKLFAVEGSVLRPLADGEGKLVVEHAGHSREVPVTVVSA